MINKFPTIAVSHFLNMKAKQISDCSLQNRMLCGLFFQQRLHENPMDIYLTFYWHLVDFFISSQI